MDARKTARIPLRGVGGPERRRRPYLTVYEGPDLGRDFALEEGETFAGREAGLAVSLQDSTVSRRHLSLQVTRSGQCFAEDLGSTNGTLVNGEPITTRHRLQDGDQIRIGSTLLKFEFKSAGSKRYTRRLYEMATRDPLTGLLNRKSLGEQLEQAWALAGKREDPVAVLMIDIDRFKLVNDRFGHQAGDLVLCRVAECLFTCLRPADVVGRMGGEEFAVVLPGQDLDTALKSAERLRQAVEEMRFRAPGPESITVSIGVASAGVGQGQSPEGLLKSADEALYKAKEAGRNRCCIVPER